MPATGVRRTIAFAAAATVLAATSSRARRGTVGGCEEEVFRTYNDAPAGLLRPAWLVMQTGSLGAVVATSAWLARRGRPRVATVAATAGTAVWAGVKVVKPLVGRGRPAHHLAGVHVRGAEQNGLGYPSGHAAVALTLGLIARPRPASAAATAGAAGLAAVTGATRMYVGAHLPLDVAGGLAIGMLAGLTGSATLDRFAVEPRS